LSLPCPSCSVPMHIEQYPGHYGREVELDVCHHCNALWFDNLESLALSPGGVVSLLKSMHQRHAEDRGPMPMRMGCPRCGELLKVCQRRSPSNLRYAAFECPTREGYLITFYNLMREKNCIRPLTGEKLKELRKHVRMVSCSNCGAPVDIQKTTACDHCKAPLALLDPDAVRQTLERLQGVEDRRANPNPDAVVADMILARLETQSNFREIEAMDRKIGVGYRAGLLEVALRTLFRLLS
jgi:Zn-finger nucleic acid-binding protein